MGPILHSSPGGDKGLRRNAARHGRAGSDIVARMKKPLLSLAALAALALAAACVGDHGHGEETPPECEALAEACHDSALPAGQACHENAEGVWTAAECSLNTEACLATCGGGGGAIDGGAIDASPVVDARPEIDAPPLVDAARP
jgi:hypothetical protein